MLSGHIKLLIVTAIASACAAFGGASAQAHGMAPTMQAHGISTTDVLSFWHVTDGNQRFNVTGKVESVSYASNTVRVRADGQTLNIIITPTTAIESQGEAGSIGDIRRGARITVSGIVRDGQKVALSITIK